MDEYGKYYNTDLTKQNILFDKEAGVDKMESHCKKDPGGSFKNPIEVNDGNGIYYRSSADNEKSEICMGPNNYNNSDHETRLCCTKPYRTSLERWLIRSLILFILLLLGSYVAFFWFFAYAGRTSIWTTDGLLPKIACHTPSCIETAGEILQSMNRDVKPCDDLFEFACGGWKRSHPIPDHQDRWDTFAVAYERIHSQIKESFERKTATNEPNSVKQLRIGYEACINQTAWDNLSVQPLIDLMEDFGGLPMITPGWEVTSFDFTKTLARLIREFNEKFIIGIYVSPDIKDSSRFMIQMEQGLLPVPKYLLSENDSNEIAKQMDVMLTVAGILLDSSLQTFRSNNKESIKVTNHEHKPFFRIPANHSYVITEKSADIITEINGETFKTILSNDTDEFKHDLKHRYSRKGYYSSQKRNQFRAESEETSDETSDETSEETSDETSDETSEETSDEMFDESSDDYTMTSDDDWSTYRIKKFKTNKDLVANLISNRYKRDSGNPYFEEIQVPFFRIPANKSYSIRHITKNIIIETNGETYEPLYSNSPGLFKYAKISKKNPDSQQYYQRTRRDTTDASRSELIRNLREQESISKIHRKEQKKTKPSRNPIPELNYQLSEEAFEKQKIIMSHDITDLWMFYRQLAKIMQQEFPSHLEDTYNPMTVEDLNKFNGRMNITWKDFLVDVMWDAEINIDDDTVINVSHHSYFEQLVPLIMNTHPRVLANAVLFQLILNMGSEISTYQEQTQAFLGRYEDKPWFDCSQKMNNLMSLATARLVYDGKSSQYDEDINTVTDLVNDLKTTFSSSIKNQAWIDEKTKNIALQKVDALVPIVGFPKKFLNNTRLDAEYQCLPNLSPTDHFGNIQKLLKFTSEKSMRKYDQKPSREDFLSSPLDVNAFYSIQRNNIQIPMGILMPPFYRKEVNKAFHYGATGAIISHELSHGFDVKGRKWDAHGNLHHWWDPHSLSTYMQKAHCYTQQYESFPLTYTVIDEEGEPIMLNSRRTLAENIADSEGLYLAWKAYMNSKEEFNKTMIGLGDYTPEQLFFIGYAQMWCSNYSPLGIKRSLLMDTHSPHPTRVNGAARNHPKFASVFNCPMNSTMFNPKLCKIW